MSEMTAKDVDVIERWGEWVVYAVARAICDEQRRLGLRTTIWETAHTFIRDEFVQQAIAALEVLPATGREPLSARTVSLPCPTGKVKT